MTRRRLVLAAALALTFCAAAPAMTQTSNQPIPGIDVVVKKQPAGSALVVGQTGRDGWFRGPIPTEAGTYQVTALCPRGRACPAFRLATVRVDGRLIVPDARGQFFFPVGSSVGTTRLEANSILQEVSTPR